MVDEDFRHFVSKFPLSTRGEPSSERHEELFAGKLPSALLAYWREFGFSGFGGGRIWLVDPLVWRHSTSIVVGGVRHPQLACPEERIPIVRDAFGRVVFWTPGFGISMILNPAQGTCYLRSRSARPIDPDRKLRAFFGSAQTRDFDIGDISGGSIFDAAVSRLGSLGVDQIYAFTPSLLIGGAASGENVSIEYAIPHMAVLHDLIGGKWLTN